MTENESNDLYSLLPSFIKEKILNNEVIDIDDLVKLDDNALDVLYKCVKSQDNIFHNSFYIHVNISLDFIKNVSFKRMKDIYNYKKSLFELIDYLSSDNGYTYIMDSEFNYINNLDLKDVDRFIDDNFRQLFYYTENRFIDVSKFPNVIINNYKELFLVDSNLPKEIKNKYFKKELSIDDVIKNISNFNPGIQRFLTRDYLPVANKLRTVFTNEELYELLNKYPKTLKTFFEDFSLASLFCDNIDKNDLDVDVHKRFKDAIKRFVVNNQLIDYTGYLNSFEVPDYLNEFNFDILPEIRDEEDFYKIDDDTIILNRRQFKFIDLLKIEKLKEFEKRYHFFFFKNNEYTGEFSKYFKLFSNGNNENNNRFLWVPHYNVDSIDYQMAYKEYYLSNYSYEEFENVMAKIIDQLRSDGMFKKYFPSYFYMDKKFREKHKEIFLTNDDDLSATNLYYVIGKTSLENLIYLGDSIYYFENIDLSNFISGGLYFYDINNNINNDFIKFYSNRYGNRELLKLLGTYGYLLKSLKIKYDINDSKEVIDKEIRNAIYNNILKERYKYKFLLNKKEAAIFIEEHPDIFIDKETMDKIDYNSYDNFSDKFYSGSIDYSDIFYYPWLKNVLINKNIKLCFHQNLCNNDRKLIDERGNEVFLDLLINYGRFLNCFEYSNSSYRYLSYQDLCNEVETDILDAIDRGGINYSHPYTIKFLVDKYPNFFLDDDAPEDLKNRFYSGLSFEDISVHKDWIPHLKGKYYYPSFAKTIRNKEELNKYFKLFSFDDAFKLMIQKPLVVKEMIEVWKAQELKAWYEKTNHKFIPEFVVMNNLSIDDIDGFLKNAKWWSKLLKNEINSTDENTKEAILKLAYVFGVFHGDDKGYKELNELLNNIPNKIKKENEDIINYLNLNSCSWIEKELEEYGLDMGNNDLVGDFLYKKDNDGNYILTINQQLYPKVVKKIREIIDDYGHKSVLNAVKAHELFGSFKMIYDPDFREFLIKNLDEILTNSYYSTYISAIQRQFSKIKVVNRNRKLTLDIALNYVLSNVYDDIEIGNEKLAEVARIAGYDNEQFEVLQQIYDYGKRRVASSIPRITGETDDFSYEMLRLDDPLALAIGTLTNCCQELGNAAEVSMEHSMTSEDGRVFVVREKDGSLVAQSWVWRNGNTICFDNIEIPDKAFDRYNDNNELAQEVYNIYLKAAEDLMAKENETFKKLLKDGKISLDDYNKLKLSKVTVGLGYNDISHAIEKNAKKDDNTIGPLSYRAPINLNNTLYTNDSEVQYVLKEENNNILNANNNIPIYYDEYDVYDDHNFNKTLLITLNNLELSCKSSNYYSKTEIYDDSESIVEQLADNYEINGDITKLIVTPNFAIIYEDGNEVILHDLLYNQKLLYDNSTKKSILKQIKLAINQIKNNKEINISNLDDNSIKIYEEALNQELDMKNTKKR